MSQTTTPTADHFRAGIVGTEVPAEQVAQLDAPAGPVTDAEFDAAWTLTVERLGREPHSNDDLDFAKALAIAVVVQVAKRDLKPHQVKRRAVIAGITSMIGRDIFDLPEDLA